jgi:drug/metabolite transporter (DMT)-like permease
VAAGILLATTLALRDPIPPATAGTAWGGVFGMALVSQLFGHTALNAAVRRLSPTFVATATLIEPALAALLAALLFGERLAPGTLAGAVLVLAAIFIALRAETRSEPVRAALSPGD